MEVQENATPNGYDYKRFAVLYVDDEEKSLKSFTRAFGETFRVFTAASAREGLQLLEEVRSDVGILMTDQRMPGEKGVWLLERARQLQPRLIRILVTAYSDMDAAVAAVNSGSIYKYVTKPWDPIQLEQTLKRGLEFFIVQRERDQLLKERMSVLHNMIIADRITSLGLLAAGLSHHIRNSLVAVKTFLDLAPTKMQEEKLELDRVRHPDFWKEYHQSVQVQIQKITSLLRELGVASDNASSDFGAQVHLHEVIAAVLARLAPEFAARSLNIENRIPDSLPVLNVDRPKFVQLFELLLKDELVSLPRGSTITLTAAVASTGSDLSSLEIDVRVRDNGPGLPIEELRWLFNPFFARSKCPLEYGINLMVCYFLVHHHGGRIRAESSNAQGTTFLITLPTNPAQARPTEESPDFLRKVLLYEALWETLASE